MSTSALSIRPFAPPDTNAVLVLWEECGLLRAGIDARAEIQRKIAFQPELFLVGELNGQIVASLMAGYEGRRGWINYLAVAGAHQRSGIGGQMLAHAEQLLHMIGCAKVNLQVLNANAQVVAFYEKHGYSIDPVISMGKRLGE
jgi:ribosomal protein S18 acetylase RimI-like enzyme